MSVLFRLGWRHQIEKWQCCTCEPKKICHWFNYWKNKRNLPVSVQCIQKVINADKSPLPQKCWDWKKTCLQRATFFASYTVYWLFVCLYSKNFEFTLFNFFWIFCYLNITWYKHVIINLMLNFFHTEARIFFWKHVITPVEKFLKFWKILQISDKNLQNFKNFYLRQKLV